MAGEEAADDGGFAAGPEGDGAFHAEGGDLLDDGGAAEEGVVEGVVDAVELGAERGQVPRGGLPGG